MRTLAENPVALIQQGAPHRIHDDETLASYTQALFRLTAKKNPSRAEHETIDLLTLLIEDYESRFRMTQASPVEVLKYLIEVGGLRQQDLGKELGSPSNISMILSGRRNLSLENAYALANRFSLDVQVFLALPQRKKNRRDSNRTRAIRPVTSTTRVSKVHRAAA